MSFEHPCTEAEWRSLADEKLASAKALMGAGQFTDAYCLLHYVIELEMKALIARKERFNQWPSRKANPKVHDHDPSRLLQLTDYRDEFAERCAESRQFKISWKMIRDMQVHHRYSMGVVTEMTAKQAFLAVNNPVYGVRTWLRRR